MPSASNVTIQELNFERALEGEHLAKYRRYIECSEQRNNRRTTTTVKLWLLVACVAAGLLIICGMNGVFSNSDFSTVFGPTASNPLTQISTLDLSGLSLTVVSTSIPKSEHLEPSEHIAQKSISGVNPLITVDRTNFQKAVLQKSILQRLSFLKDEIEATQFSIQLIGASQTALSEAELGQLKAKLEQLLHDYNNVKNHLVVPDISTSNGNHN